MRFLKTTYTVDENYKIEKRNIDGLFPDFKTKIDYQQIINQNM